MDGLEVEGTTILKVVVDDLEDSSRGLVDDLFLYVCVELIRQRLGDLFKPVYDLRDGLRFEVVLGIETFVL